MNASAAHAAPRSCGTAWTGWVDQANPDKNPCPKHCTRGERLKDRQHKQGAKTQYDVQYQCYVAEASAPASTGASAPAKPAAAPSSAAARPALSNAPSGTALTKASPAEPGAAQGAWIGWDQLFHPDSRTPGDTAWEPTLRTVATIVRESPALKDLGGYYPQIQVLVNTKSESVPYARLQLTAWWPEAIEPDPGAKPGEKNFRKKPAFRFKPDGLNVRLNWVPREPQAIGLSELPWGRDAAGVFFALPPASRSIAGSPVIGSQLVITAKGKAPLFVPVAQERAYKAAIAYARTQAKDSAAGQGAGSEALASFNSKEMKDIRRKMIEEAAAQHKDPARAAAARKKAEADDREQERQLREAAGGGAAGSDPAAKAAQKTIAELEAKLAAMTPEQRRASAYVKPAADSILTDQPVPAGTADALPLVEFNKGFLDRKLPAHTLQIAMMPAEARLEGLQRHSKEITQRVVTAVTEQTDWARLAALMK